MWGRVARTSLSAKNSGIPAEPTVCRWARLTLRPFLREAGTTSGWRSAFRAASTDANERGFSRWRNSAPLLDVFRELH